MKHKILLACAMMTPVLIPALEMRFNGRSVTLKTGRKIPILSETLDLVHDYYHESTPTTYMADLNATARHAQQYIAKVHQHFKNLYNERIDAIDTQALKKQKVAFDKQTTSIESAKKEREKIVRAKDQYTQDLGLIENKRTADKAKELQRQKKPTIIFDVDDTLIETSLKAKNEIKNGCYCYDSHARKNMMQPQPKSPRNKPSLKPIAELFKWAKEQGLTIAIISNRVESDKQETINNLKAIGCGGYDYLLLRPDNGNTKADIVKNRFRGNLVKEGCEIFASFGDQFTDFMGTNTGRGYKLPNYISQYQGSGTLPVSSKMVTITAQKKNR